MRLVDVVAASTAAPFGVSRGRGDELSAAKAGRAASQGGDEVGTVDVGGGSSQEVGELTLMGSESGMLLSSEPNDSEPGVVEREPGLGLC